MFSVSKIELPKRNQIGGMNIVFNINPLGLEGLEATVSSLIRSCSDPAKLTIWFLCADFRSDNKGDIVRLLSEENFKGRSEFIDYNSHELFGHLRPLHGDWSTYGKLVIANYVDGDTALYLDSDLIVIVDILTLLNFEFHGAVLAAVCGSTIEHVLDKTFFIQRLNSPLNQKYFNAGVVLFDLKRWRETNVDEYWATLASKYPAELVSHDQTLLNAICGGNFAHLPFNFNNPWYPGSKAPENSTNSIIHFVGSPKPWDVLGSIIHKGYPTWSSYTTGAWKNKYSQLSIDKLRRSWKIRKSIARHLKSIIITSFGLH